jgi:hypothetical protein
MDIVYERPPLPYPATLRALASCCASTARLLRQHRLRLPARRVGTHLHFADGTSARVYRETVADRGATLDPCVLVVEFRLRAVRGRGHAAFRWESLLNTPLWRVLALVSVPGSIHYVVLPGLRRNAVLEQPQLLGGDDAWWRLVEVT